MKRGWFLCAGLLLACQTSGLAPAEQGPTATVTVPLEAASVPGVLDGGELCDAGDATFVRRLIPQLWGRRAASAREVALLSSIITERDRETLVRAMMRSDEYEKRWMNFMKDTLHVNRVGERTNDCVADGYLWNYNGELAAFVRDTPPDGPAFETQWNLTDLLASAIVLDDLSPVYLAQFFAQLGSKIINLDNPGANLAWRAVYGDIFERTYLNRRMGCLGCHNSEFSVTDSADPALDRTWQLPGLVEKALYGSSAGRPVQDLHAFFRVEGVLSMEFVPEGVTPTNFWTYGPGHNPWGMSPGCGEFILPEDIEPDAEGWTAHLIDPVDDRPSIWTLEQRLRSGFAKLRADGMPVAEDGTVDGETALASMVTVTLVEKVWLELTGRRLTAPHFFPRNRYQRDLLVHLNETFIEHGFSLKELLVAAVLHPYFNPGHPTQCGDVPGYYMAPIYDPWAVDHDDPALRGNSVGDMVERVPPRVLMDAVTTALEWPAIQDSNEAIDTEDIILDPTTAFQLDIGVFLMDGETGFRGSNITEAFAWEEAFGSCRAPFREEGAPAVADWIYRLLSAAKPNQSLQEAVVAIKDRLTARTSLTSTERGLLSALAGTSLSTALKDVDDIDGTLRRICAAFLASPQFQFAGAPVTESVDLNPSIIVPGTSTPELCNLARVQLFEPGAVECDAAGALTFIP